MDLTLRLLHPPRKAPAVLGAPVTKEGLLKHAKRFANPERGGADNAEKTINAIAEVADEHGISVTLPNVAAEKKQRAPSLKKRIREHLAREMSWTQIAEIENLSPSRARKLRMEIEEKGA